MREILAVAAALLLPAAAGAAALESLSAAADREFAQAPLALRAALEAASAPDTLLQPPPLPRPALPASGAVLARMDLAAQLDRNLRLTNEMFGSRPLDLGIASDAGFKKFFLTFSDRETTALAPIESLGQLRGDGLDIRLDASTVYNFRLEINIFSPIRGSTLYMTPAAGRPGPSHEISTGDLIDAISARAVTMTLDGSEYWIFYGRDALPNGGFGTTRSFLFVHMNGLFSKAWPLAESALTPDQPKAVDLGGVPISVTRTSAGQLVVRAAN